MCIGSPLTKSLSLFLSAGGTACDGNMQTYWKPDITTSLFAKCRSVAAVFLLQRTVYIIRDNSYYCDLPKEM